jgi:hypothetical protein
VYLGSSSPHNLLPEIIDPNYIPFHPIRLRLSPSIQYRESHLSIVASSIKPSFQAATMASGGASPFPTKDSPQVMGSTGIGSSSLNPDSLSASIVSQTEKFKTKICVFCGASPGNSPAHMVYLLQASSRIFARSQTELTTTPTTGSCSSTRACFSRE